MVSSVVAGSIAVLEFGNRAQVLLIVDEQGRHVLDRHDMVDHAGVGCTLRHATLSDMVELGLSQGQPAALLDHAHAECAIAADTGQDDADGLVAAVLLQAMQKTCLWGGDARAEEPERPL